MTSLCTPTGCAWTPRGDDDDDGDDREWPAAASVRPQAEPCDQSGVAADDIKQKGHLFHLVVVAASVGK